MSVLQKINTEYSIDDFEISTGNPQSLHAHESPQSPHIALISSPNNQEFLHAAESMAYRFDPRLQGFTGRLQTFSPNINNRLVVIAADISDSDELIVGSAVAFLYKPSSCLRYSPNHSSSQVCVLKTISILPDYRIQGIGGKLVNYLLKYYKQPIICYFNKQNIEENYRLSMNSLSFFKAIGAKIINNFDKHGSIKVILLPSVSNL